MMDGRIKTYASFFGVSLALGIAPGPDILFVLAQSMSQGFLAGSCVTLGLCSGLCVHGVLAAFGFAALMKRWPALFKAITWFGAAYLAWLAWGAWRAASTVEVGAAAQELPALRLYLRGVVMNLCNPKVVLFFLALMPRFIDAKRGRVAAQFLLLAGIFAVATLLVFNSVAAGGGLLANAFSSSPRAGVMLQYFSAVVMLGLALWIAWMNVRRAADQTSSV